MDLWDRDGTTLYEDMARRDFTVNSFALDPRTGTLFDPFGGVGDMERRLLKHIQRRMDDVGDALAASRVLRQLVAVDTAIARKIREALLAGSTLRARRCFLEQGNRHHEV